MTANKNLIYISFGKIPSNIFQYSGNYSWKPQSHENRFPKCTAVEGKRLKDTMIRAFYYEDKKIVVFLSCGELHFIT